MRRRISISAYLLLSALWTVAQDQYQSLFWEISGNGLEEPSYLYGTMHTQDERAFDFKDGVLDAFNNCSAYAMELNMDSVDQMEIMSLLMMEGDAALDNLLTEEEYEYVNTFFTDSVGVGLIMFNKMQPMYTSSMVSLRSLNSQESEALDLYFFSMAKEQGKAVYGLEEMVEQIGAFNSIDYGKQAEGLVEAVDAAYDGSGDAEVAAMMDVYANGDLDSLLVMTQSADSDLDSNFSKTFLIDRNHRMANRAVPMIKEGSVFIAVGAAHLPGEQGVIELLRAKGYTVTPK